jgi:hypothetical protein
MDMLKNARNTSDWDTVMLTTEAYAPRKIINGNLVWQTAWLGYWPLLHIQCRWCDWNGLGKPLYIKHIFCPTFWGAVSNTSDEIAVSSPIQSMRQNLQVCETVSSNISPKVNWKFVSDVWTTLCGLISLQMFMVWKFSMPFAVKPT